MAPEGFAAQQCGGRDLQVPGCLPGQQTGQHTGHYAPRSWLLGRLLQGKEQEAPGPSDQERWAG